MLTPLSLLPRGKMVTQKLYLGHCRIYQHNAFRQLWEDKGWETVKQEASDNLLMFSRCEADPILSSDC